MNTGLDIGSVLSFGLKKIMDESGQFDWEYIQSLDWFQAMQDCPQDPIFHAEGDVGIHTQMVVDALENLAAFDALDEGEQLLLRLAALLHDIAKPACTLKTDDGHIRAPKHAVIGEKIVRELFWESDFEFRERLCGLVRLHGLPVWCLEKPLPLTALYKASLRLNNWQLYLLAQADMLGREGEGVDAFLDRVEMYRLLAEEQDCLRGAKGFHNTHSKFQFFFKQQEHPPMLFDDTAFEVTILSGIPGSGKDTYCKQFDRPVVSLDAIRKEMNIKPTDKKAQGKVVQMAYKRAKTYSAQKQSFIWNSTNLTTDMRAKVIRKLAPYNPKFNIVYIETTRKNILSRRRATIPIKKIEKMFRMLEVPQPYEAHQVEYLISKE